ncbi:MAG TPA: hypothetical protein VE053_03000 [Allosphingosinicella sp.]|nr:hypothetical protein [Allosphingosinicella sp.]
MNGKPQSVRGADGRFAGTKDGEAAAGKARAPAAKGKNGWTAAKEAVFFRELATVCNVSAALRACGMFRRSSDVYDRRREEPAFRERWDSAVDEGYALLDLEMLERARFASRRPPPQTDAEKRLREVPTGLGLQLLKLYHVRKAKAPPPPAARATAAARRIDGAALRREFDAMLSDFNRRMGGQG